MYPLKFATFIVRNMYSMLTCNLTISPSQSTLETPTVYLTEPLDDYEHTSTELYTFLEYVGFPCYYHQLVKYHIHKVRLGAQ